MIFDSHMHSKFSTDSDMNIENAIAVGKEKNIGIIITDHMDLDYPVADEFRFNIPEYFKEYEKYRSDRVKLGIEIGLTENTLLANENIGQTYDFDFILGSIHAVDGLDIYLDYRNKSYTKKDFFINYLECMLRCIKLHNNFDSLSHIDYPCRYASFDNNEILVSEFKDILSEIFTTLINKDKVLELNTARLRDLDANNALIDIYKLYKDLGGKYVTLGSDAHRHLNIANNFNLAFEFINTVGLQGVYFDKRTLKGF
ncbi:MAG: histidinol phosphate phosphatase [Clostridium sp.]|nr:histidinol phosphate phosphatase [Clostridium sp.]